MLTDRQLQPAMATKGTHCTVSFRTLVRRARRLGLTLEDIRGCVLIEDVQRLAKVRYRALARRYHPDLVAAARIGQRQRGAMFRRIAKTYAWIMGLPGWQCLDHGYWVPLSTAPLPTSLERPTADIGPGWQITWRP